MAKVDLNSIKKEILSRINIREELETIGIQFQGQPSASGWIPCFNPYKLEQHPSCGVNVSSGPMSGYMVIFNMANGNKLSRAFSFFDLAIDFMPQSGGDFYNVLKYFAKKAGVSLTSSSKPPTEEQVLFFKQNLTGEQLDDLHSKRGLTDETIDKYKLGWSDKRKRYTIPVYDENDALVNIRYHSSKLKPKTLNTAGYGEARIYNLKSLIDAPEGSTVTIHEGEFDAMITSQETGLVSVSPTNGCKAFFVGWAQYFHGKHVIIVFDCDTEGRDAVTNIVLPALRTAVISKKILSLKVVWLFHNIDKENKDATDWFVKCGGTKEKFFQLVENTQPFVFKEAWNILPDAKPLSSLVEIEHPENAGIRVTVPLYVYGENAEAYHSPTEFQVTYCPLLEQKKCPGRDDWDWNCSEPIKISIGSRIQLAGVATTDRQLKNALCDYVCHRNRRPGIDIKDKDHITLRELLVHQVFKNNVPDAKNELVEKAVYNIGGSIIPIGQYQATGFVHTHPKSQKPTMLIDTIEKQDQDWQGFSIEKAEVDLEQLQTMDPMDIVEELSMNVTHIYERDDIHLGVLLTLMSPQWIYFPGDGMIRGWISTVVIGDSASGKTDISQLIFNHAHVGQRVSGMTSSRTGITYALDYDEKHGWRIKAGALLKMSRQALIIDEAQDLPEEDLKTMSDSIDSGQIVVSRVITRSFEARTRCFFSCNPKMVARQSNQRTMDSFRYGCQSLMDIFPVMMLRRLDLALFAAQFDIEDSNKLYDLRNPVKNPIVTSERLRHLVHFAWNLKPEQIHISKEVATRIRRSAQELSDKYGQCADLPLVCPQDFRKTLCRLVTALAVLDLSSTDGFQTIEVTDLHVRFMHEVFLDNIYSNNNCRLDQYSDTYLKHHVLTSDQKKRLYKEFSELLMASDTETRKRIIYMFREIANMVPDSQNKISQREFAEHFNCDRYTIRRDLSFFVNNRMIESSRGYRPYTKCISFFNFVVDQARKEDSLGLFKSLTI